jgi:hypothetical protein
VRKPVSGCKLWNLWELMKVFKAREFAFILLDLHQYSIDCDDRKRHEKSGITVFSAQPVPDEFIDGVLKKWREALLLCEDIKLENAAKSLRMAIVNLQSGQRNQFDYSSLGTDFRHVFETISSDFWSRKFIQISEDYGKYVNNDALFGAEVSSAFADAGPELREAGNCLAVDCGTAAVFHLMRAVECGLREFCGHLGIKNIRKSKKPGNKKMVPIEYSQWEKILEDARDRVDAKINRMKPGKAKQEAQEFYYPLLQDLRGFKDAWRNHVMHARQAYTVKDAEAIMDHVRGFLLRVSTKVT